jgi:hypothetical protein
MIFPIRVPAPSGSCPRTYQKRWHSPRSGEAPASYSTTSVRLNKGVPHPYAPFPTGFVPADRVGSLSSVPGQECRQL